MQTYYRSRPGPSTFEQGYWEAKVDPDGVTRNLTQERERKLDDMREELEFVNALPPGRVLDVGSGLGHFLSAVDPKHTRVGFEVSKWAHEWAEDRYSHLRPSIQFWHGDDLRDNGFRPCGFDCIVLYHVIEHAVYPLDLLAEIHRILRWGGHLVLGTPDFDCIAARLFGNRFRLLNDQTHISLFSQDGVRRMLTDYGFDVEKVETPFFGTKHATEANLKRMLEPEKGLSPPFVGNIFTVYATKARRLP